MHTITPTPATVEIGSRSFPFTSFAEVSAAYRATIDRLGLGGSQTPKCLLKDSGGGIFGYVSYNGRVWRGHPRDWSAMTQLVFDPRG